MPLSRQQTAKEEVHPPARWLEAVASGQIDVVRRGIEAGLVGVCDQYGSTPLMVAVRGGWPEVIAALLAADEDPLEHRRPMTGGQWQPRPVASVDEVVSELLEDVAAQPVMRSVIVLEDTHRDRALEARYAPASAVETAVVYDRLDLLEMLLARVADGRRDGRDVRPLSLACEMGRLDAVERVLAAGLTSPRDDRWPPLIEAAARGHLEIVERLIAEGARVGARVLVAAESSGNSEVYSLLADHRTCQLAQEEAFERRRNLSRADPTSPESQLLRAVAIGRVADASRALAEGASVDVYDGEGRTPLMEASIAAPPAILDLLLVSDADPNLTSRAPGEEGQTALMLAAYSWFGHRRPETLRRLHAAGADVNARDARQRTALILCLATGVAYFDSLSCLLELGADPCPRDDDGSTALAYAVQKGHTRAAALLREYGAQDDGLAEVAMLEATDRGDLDALLQLLAGGVYVDYRLDWTALMIASIRGDGALVECLLAAGADPDRGARSGGSCPVMLACRAGHLDVLELLYVAGADFTIRDGKSGSAIDVVRASRRNPLLADRPWEDIERFLEEATVAAVS